jgi:hypothetical protein
MSLWQLPREAVFWDGRPTDSLPIQPCCGRCIGGSLAGRLTSGHTCHSTLSSSSSHRC